MLFQRQKAVSAARIRTNLFFDRDEDVTFWLRGKAEFREKDGQICDVRGKSENAAKAADRRVEEPLVSEWLKQKAQGKPANALITTRQWFLGFLETYLSPYIQVAWGT